VGRNHELVVLGEYLQRAKHRQGQVVFVSGEAGIGKSRLLLEFRGSIQDEDITWLEGQCISFGQNISYLPFIDILKHTFGVEEEDSEVRIIQRVDEGTAQWDDATGMTVPYLKHLLNVDPGDPAIATMDARERRAGIFDGLRALLIQESRRQPLVLVVEDLHWIDEQSEEALAVLVDVVASAPVLLILTYRPGYTHSLGERTYYNRLALGNLPIEESAAMVQSVLQVATLPQKLQELITSKAEGNPFYIEEVISSLLESGVLRKMDSDYVLARPIEQVRVPDTVQEVILSRIDRLEREAKEAIQLASVIGREFTIRLLESISDIQAKLETPLEELKLLELIYQKEYFPELSYMFKHALTQDVAYSTLLLERRKALHRFIGAAIEKLYADRLPELYEFLAHHYHEGEDLAKALDYLEKAGDKAKAAFANQDALDYYAQALEVCEKLGDSTLATSASIAQKRGPANMAIGNYSDAVDDFNRVIDIARRLGDRRLEGMALAYRSVPEHWLHEFETEEWTLRAALAIGDEGFDDVRFAASAWLGGVFLTLGRSPENEPFMRIAEELAPRVDEPFWQAWLGLAGFLGYNWGGAFRRRPGVCESVARNRRSNP
jgi:predicted ATPase